MKRYIALFGVLGIVGCFLPLIGGTSVSLFDLRHHVGAWIMLAAFVVPVLAWRSRMGAFASLASFAYLAIFRTKLTSLILYAGIGGKLIGVAIIGGVIASIATLVEKRVDVDAVLDDHATR